MSGVNIEYKGESIATIPDTGSKTIKTQGKYCEGDILVEYEAPPAPTPTLQSKTVTPTVSQQSVTPDSGYDGLSDVTVNATPLEAKTVTPTSQQQVVTPTAPNIGLSSVTVGAAPTPTLQSKTVTPTTSQQSVTPDSGYDGLSDVTVNATPLEAKTVTPTSQQQVVTPTAPNIGLSSVTVGAAPTPTLITKQITANGTYAAEDDNADGYSEIDVNVPDESKAVLNSLIDRSITSITSDVTTVGSYAFYNCTALTEVNFPNVTTIRNYAFNGCTALTEVNFPNVTFMAGYAFYNCKAIEYFDMSEVSEVPRISSNTFQSTTCIFLFRDQTQLDTYARATNWSALASRFQIKGV